MDKFTSMMVFVKSVELGSFTAAAETFNISAQLAGRCVQETEQRLGVKLLNRTTRRQSLTDFGRQFYERAKVILAEIEEAEALAAQTHATPRGKLRINAPVSFGMKTLTPRLPEYMRAYPHVEVELRLNNRWVDLIDEGYDAVFRIGRLPDSGLVSRTLAPYELVACASPHYLSVFGVPDTPQDLVHHRCLVLSHTELHTHWYFEGKNGETAVPVSGKFVSDHDEPLFQAALSGLGIVLQPREIVRDALEDGRLIPILPEYKVPARPLHIIYAPDRLITPKLRSFLDFAMATFK